MTKKAAHAWPADAQAASDVWQPLPDPTATTYRPHAKQHAFHESTETFVGYIGGLGSGKSVANHAQGYYYAAHYNRDHRHIGLFGAPTYRMLKDITIPGVRAFFPDATLRGGSWARAFVKSDMALYLANGTEILFRSLDGRNYERVRGVELTWFGVDEARLLQTRDAWEVLQGRLRGPGRRRGGWTCTTPNGEDWVAESFIINPLAHHACVRGTSYDNARALPPEYLDRLRATYSRAFFEQEVLGRIVRPRGAVYPMERHHWPRGNVLPMRVDKRRPTLLAVDFGRLHPRAVLLQSVKVKHPETQERVQCWVVVDELQDKDGRPPYDVLVEEVAAGVKAMGYRLVGVVGDPAGDSRNDLDHETSASKLCDLLGGVHFTAPYGEQRLKGRGERLVASWVCSYGGTRRLLWASTKVAHPLGGYYTRAENSMKAFLSLRYPDRKPGQAAPTESLKDGQWDHDTDAVRYFLVVHEDGTPFDLEQPYMGRLVA